MSVLARRLRKAVLIGGVAALLVGLMPTVGSADDDPFGGNDPFDATELVEPEGPPIKALSIPPDPFGNDPTIITGFKVDVCGPAPSYNAQAARPGRKELRSFFLSWEGVPNVFGFSCREINDTSIKPSCNGQSPAWSDCWSTHAAGRALDVMVCSGSGCGNNQSEPVINQALGDAIADYLFEEIDGYPAHRAREMGVMQIIWHDHCWNATNSYDQTVTSMSMMRSCGKRDHDNHLHLTLTDAGADGLTSWFDEGGIPPTPEPPDTWQTGTPSWAMPDTEQAVEIGLLDPSIAGDDTLQRHEVAVIFDRLGLLYGQPQPASGNWVTGTPLASMDAMGRMVSRGYWSPTVAGSTDVPRTHMAAVFDRAGFVAGEPVAAPGAWETGTPSWAHTVMGRSVSAGLFSKDVPGDRTLTRYELAVVLGRLDMLASWRKGTPAFAISAMTEAVDRGLLSADVPGADVLERDETAALLDRLGLLTADPEAPSGNWETGTRTWFKPSMSKAVAQGIWASHVEGSDTVTRMELAIVLDRLGFLAGQPVAAAGTWEIGTPSWAHASMGRAVSAGVLSANTRGDDLVTRFVFAVVVDDRLGLLSG